jgi:hypothetical protein
MNIGSLALEYKPVEELQLKMNIYKKSTLLDRVIRDKIINENNESYQNSTDHVSDILEISKNHCHTNKNDLESHQLSTPSKQDSSSS